MKALENQQTNLRKAKCGCTINGIKHNTIINAGDGYIVRTQSNDYKVYCKDCYDKIAKRTANNNKIATLQGSTVKKTTINEQWQHSFSFYINKNNVEAINLLKRLHYVISNGGNKMVKAISPLESNLNGIQKNFTNLIENFNFKNNAKTTIVTYKDNKEVSTIKTTIDKAINKAKEQRENNL